MKSEIILGKMVEIMFMIFSVVENSNHFLLPTLKVFLMAFTLPFSFIDRYSLMQETRLWLFKAVNPFTDRFCAVNSILIVLNNYFPSLY